MFVITRFVVSRFFSTHFTIAGEEYFYAEDVVIDVPPDSTEHPILV